jgi:hypothetical protein
MLYRMTAGHLRLSVGISPRPVCVDLGRIQGLQLAQDRDDKFIWKWSINQQYSAYKAFFIGQSSFPGAKELRKVATPPRCKFFIWFAPMDRSWTSAWLQRHC